MQPALVHLDAAKAHYRPRLLGPPRIVDVPEWGAPDGPLRLHVWPLTLREQQEINGHDGLRRLVATVIVRGRAADRSRIFHLTQLDDFMNETDPEVITRIVLEIARGDLTKEQVEGESQPTPSSSSSSSSGIG